MNRIYIEKISNIYSGNKCDDNYPLSILADWFTDDVAGHIPSWREWLVDRSEAAESTESNATWLEKDWLDDGSCIVTFGRTLEIFLVPKGQIYAPKDEDLLFIPLDKVLELLDTWEKLIKNRPVGIIITEENGVYTMFETDVPDDREYKNIMRFPVK